MTQPTAAETRLGWESAEVRRRIRRRHAANRRLRLYGIAAICTAIGLLATLVVSLVLLGSPAFVQTKLEMPVHLDTRHVDPAQPARGNYRAIVRSSFLSLFPEGAAMSPRDQRALFQILSNGAALAVRDHVVANPGDLGKTVTLSVPLSDPYDQLNKGKIRRDLPENRRTVNDRQLAWFDHLNAQGLVSMPFNWAMFFNSDSRFPELAGMAGALVGSFYALIVCFLISFPVGIAAAIYLEEFAPRNRWTDVIEVNVNNLAAVPSIVFGLLGLAVFLNFFNMPRSAPLVGGMVLSLMTLPTIIIVTRAALKAVPPSIREAALGVGASKHQVTLHHVLPLAMPGILTGTIIGMAQALGETAPLLLIGMNAFIVEPPGGILEPATALPTQIFIWADSPERGFAARTAGGILVLLGFLVMMNMIAVWLRKRFERRW
jgi:phosphate transport system permease protein